MDYDFEATWGVSRVTFETFTLGTLVLLAALGLVGYLRGAVVRSAPLTSRATQGPASSRTSSIINAEQETN